MLTAGKFANKGLCNGLLLVKSSFEVLGDFDLHVEEALQQLDSSGVEANR